MDRRYKNMYLVFGTIVVLFLFMIASTVVVLNNVNEGRSCVRTCDHTPASLYLKG